MMNNTARLLNRCNGDGCGSGNNWWGQGLEGAGEQILHIHTRICTMYSVLYCKDQNTLYYCPNLNPTGLGCGPVQTWSTTGPA
jgi:hypothetical protein